MYDVFIKLNFEYSVGDVKAKIVFIVIFNEISIKIIKLKYLYYKFFQLLDIINNLMLKLNNNITINNLTDEFKFQTIPSSVVINLINNYLITYY